MGKPTVGVTGAGAGVDSAWERKNLEAAESPASSARCVRQRTSFLHISNTFRRCCM